MADYKQLCAELVQDLAVYVECDLRPSDLPFEAAESYALIERARAALAEAQ